LILEHKKSFHFEENVRKIMEEQRRMKKSKEPLTKVLKTIEKICVFCFMWIIVLTLFFMAISGEKMTLSRITNMSFCLAYILLFHLSFKLWLKTMYVFWSTLIIYAVCALILIYAYQFDDFPSIPLQTEIGLEKYQTGRLLVKLLSFTLVIFLTGLQMNKFHHTFLKFIERKQQKLGRVNVEESSRNEPENVSGTSRK
jgi:hypothetical protein